MRELDSSISPHACLVKLKAARLNISKCLMRGDTYLRHDFVTNLVWYCSAINDRPSNSVLVPLTCLLDTIVECNLKQNACSRPEHEPSGE